jgi:hypothetical protein
MRKITKEYNVYTFDELSDKAKEKAIEKFYDINTDHEWWEFVYEDAKNIGLNITEFDIDRGAYVKLGFEKSELETARAIVENHGESCDTHKISRAYVDEYESLEREKEAISQSDDDAAYEKETAIEDKMEVLKDEYMNDLQNEYLKILRNGYEYLTSEEAIIETIKANEYEFLEDGTLA